MQDTEAGEDRGTALMRAVGAGDRLAFAELYDRHASAVYGLAMSLVRDPSVARDVSQEAFVRLWTRAQTFDPARGTALVWLLQVTRNLAVDQLRNQRRRAERADRFARAAEMPDEAQPDLLLQWGWESDRVLEAVSKLSSIQRETVELVYLQGYTLTEVARRLDVAVGTVKSRLHSALLSLRAALAERPRSAGSATEPVSG